MEVRFMERIEVFGDKFKVRKTYDIDNSGIGQYGFEVYDGSDKFLCHFVGEKIDDLKQYIRIIFYKNYDSLE
jgi:hypothetical protein